MPKHKYDKYLKNNTFDDLAKEALDDDAAIAAMDKAHMRASIALNLSDIDRANNNILNVLDKERQNIDPVNDREIEANCNWIEANQRAIRKRLDLCLLGSRQEKGCHCDKCDPQGEKEYE